MPAAKGKKTRTSRTKELEAWVFRNHFPRGTSSTAEEIATRVSGALGYPVRPNTVCRILRKLKLKFKASKNDPGPRNYTKVDILRGQVEGMEKRLVTVESILKKLRLEK